MNEINNNASFIKNLDCLYNLNDNKSESTLNMSQNEIKDVTDKILNKAYTNRTRAFSFSYKKNKIIKKYVKNGDNFTRSKSFLKTNLKRTRENLRFKKLKKTFLRHNSYLKELNNPKVLKTKKTNNTTRPKKTRSKSLKTSFSSLYSSFNKIFVEFIPVTALILNIPKNQKIEMVYEKINCKIYKEFIHFKYNKIKGHVYIKFRNIFYYNYYYCLFKGRSFFPNSNTLKMIKIEEKNGMWDVDPLKEEEKKMTLEQKDDFFYKSYICRNFKSISYK